MNVLEVINLARKIIDEKTQKKLDELSTELFCIELIKRISEVLTENKEKFTYIDSDSLIVEDEDGFCRPTAIFKKVDPVRMELTCRCPCCSEPHNFLITDKLQQEKYKVWKCFNCKNEFVLGEF